MRHVVTLLFVGATCAIASPAAVVGQSPKATSVAISYGHACATTSDGPLYCWGGNEFGQLGIGTKKAQLTPARVSGVAGISKVVVGGASTSKQVGFFSCALAAEGRAYCWGNNDLGQLGDGTRKDHLVPAPVAGGLGFTDLRAGAASVCGLTEDKRLFCWGAIGGVGLGMGASGAVLTVERPTEITLPGTAKPAGLIADAVGDPCVMGDDGAAYCWTAEGNQLRVDRVTPPDRSFRAVQLGGMMRKCGITRADELFCWSDVTDGRMELSLRSFSGRWSSGAFGRFQLLAHGTRFKELIRGDGTCALAVDGKVLCATSDAMEAPEMPALNPEAEGLTVAALHWRSSDRCALTTAGEVYCWSASERSPVRIGSGTTFSSLTTRGSNACGIATDGALWCWGENAEGQVGDGTRKPRQVPAAVTIR